MRLNNQSYSLPVQNKNQEQSVVRFSGRADQVKEAAGKLVNKYDKFFKAIDSDGVNMTTPIILSLVYGAVVGNRAIKARNNDERREVLTRDITSVTTILFAFPFFKRASATLFRKKAGFVLSKKADNAKQHGPLGRIWDHIRIEGDKVLSTKEIAEFYKNINNLKGDNKLVTFCNKINEYEGNLKRMFGFLDKESKGLLNTIAAGADKTFKALNNNDEIIKMFEDAYKNTSMKDNLKELEKALSKDGNSLQRYAKFFKCIPDFVSIFVVIPLALGFFLPWFNQQYTKQKYKNLKNSQPPNTVNPNSVSSNVQVNSQPGMNGNKIKQNELITKFITKNKADNKNHK